MENEDGLKVRHIEEESTISQKAVPYDSDCEGVGRGSLGSPRGKDALAPF
jgi:hypothetical protein